MNKAICVLAAALCQIAGAKVKSPAESAFFERFEDPKSGAFSYILKKDVAGFNQQHLYFSTKSMTDDGRFLVISYAADEAGHAVTNESQKALAVIDLEKDAVYKLPSLGKFSIPFLDVKTSQLYCADRTDETMCRFDLTSDTPTHKIRLCDMPHDIQALGPINRWYTHLTLTVDRTRAFLDISVFGKRWIQGLLRLSDGTFEKWSETDFPCGHGQINPVNDRVAYAGRSRPGWHRVPDTRKGAKPGDTRLVKIPPGTVYPCMWLLKPGEKPRMIPSRDINHSTHQNWTEDGKGWYWCSRIPGKEKHRYARWGVYYYDLATDSETKVSDVQAGHAAMTADRSAITYDWGEWMPELNGYSWRVGYQDLRTKKETFLFTGMPKYYDKSNLHAHPHPQFVCRDGWILTTVMMPGKRLSVALAPVEQFSRR